MKTVETINFRIGLNDETIAPKFYWDVNWVRGWKNGILNINGFDNPEFTDVSSTFCWKVHNIALALACFINSYYYEDLDILAATDLESVPVWKSFKKIVADLMVKHKIGKGIKIGGYSKSFLGSSDTYNWCAVSKIGKMLNKGELVKVGHADFGSGIHGTLVEVKDDRKIVLREKQVREFLERPKYTTAFINEKPAG